MFEVQCGPPLVDNDVAHACEVDGWAGWLGLACGVEEHVVEQVSQVNNKDI